jgi:cyclic pyranopterin phosphate synthase
MSKKALTDSFGRVHDYLRISITDHCNLRCTYCMPEDIRFRENERLMRTDEVLAMARFFVEEYGIGKIRITGGEPLVHKDAGLMLRQLGALPVKLSLTTNGILLDKVMEDVLAAGMTTVNISLDSLEAETFLRLTRRDAFEKVMENIRLSLRHGLAVKLNAVAMRGENENELVDFVALTRDPQMHVRFIEFMPFSGNGWEWNKVLPASEILESLKQHFNFSEIPGGPNSTAKVYRVDGFEGSFGIISTVTEPFCGTCNRIRLTADGKLRNCLFARQETDLLTALRKGEDLHPLIESAIASKAAALGGLPVFTEREALMEALSDRAMVKIGG